MSEGEEATGRNPNERYCSLPDELCAQQWFGQKTQKGWYVYDPSSPRKPLESQEALDLINQYRIAKVYPVAASTAGGDVCVLAGYPCEAGE